MSPSRSQDKPTTLPDLMRGVAGAVLLGIPLVYTQEVWMLGATLSPWQILVILCLAFAISVALSRFVGFEPGRTFRPIEDAVVGFGLSFLLAATLLVLLDRVDPATPLDNALGIVALSSVPMSIGFALGNALAPREGGEGSERLAASGSGELLAAAAGAVVLSLNIAPTEEPVLLAYEIGISRLVLLVIVSLVLSYAMVFYAEFGGRENRSKARGVLQSPSVETSVAYLIAFIISAILLAMFGRLDGPTGASLAEITVLSFPASMGAALGRVIV